YSLLSIYQADILAQNTTPMLFQAITHNNLATTYTLIDANTNSVEGESAWFNSLFSEQTQLTDISTLVFAERLNNLAPGLHLIYFKSGEEEAESKNNHYQFELFVDALLLAQKHKQQKDFIWISTIGNKDKESRLSTKTALFINPSLAASQEVTQLTSQMDLQPSLLKHWLGCAINSKSYSNGDDLISLKKDRVIANTADEGIMVFNKDKSVLIDQNGNFQSYSSQLAAPITVNKDFPLMIDGVHFIKRFSQQSTSEQ
ncbi:MAG: hypothetical protein OQK03_14820, partial [Colwellia sp.]|nr:hypothetical protein [Colwellia sp.]